MARKVLLLSIKRDAKVARDLEQPMRKLVMILELTNLFVRFDKSVLAYVKGIFPIASEAQAIAEKLLLPASNKEIERFSVSTHHPLRQISISQRDKRQCLSSLGKDVKVGQKVERLDLFSRLAPPPGILGKV
jgi:hypothetical protein